MGKRIRALRRAKDLTQGQLAEMCGCSQATIANIEQGKRKPSIGLAFEISKALETTLDYLLTGKS